MKKAILFGIILILFSSVYALNIELQNPTNVASNKVFSTYLILTGGADNVDVGIIIPENVEMKSWEILGMPKEDVTFTKEEVRGEPMLHFKMNAVPDKITLKVDFVTNETTKIKYVVTYKKGNFTSLAYKEANIKIKEAVCGNGICEPGENSINCPVDCGTEKTNYILIIIIAIIAVGGVSYWLWRRVKNVH